MVNGKPVLLKGVNLHEFNQTTGQVITEADVTRDMERMKQLNVNAIRLSHYPQPSFLYDLADQYGFYIVDEANIESHGMGYDRAKGKSLANNLDWTEAHLFRTRNMFGRDKNHPSVVIWSLGNRSWKRLQFLSDPTFLSPVAIRIDPIQYEQAGHEWNTDIVCPMYAKPQHMNITQITSPTDHSFSVSMHMPWETASVIKKTTGTSLKNTPTCRAVSSGTGWTRDWSMK